MVRDGHGVQRHRIVRSVTRQPDPGPGTGRSGTFRGLGVATHYDARAVTDEPDPIEDAWANLQEHWDDAESHRRFIALCATLGRLPEAGRRYREVRDGDPARRETAERQIDRLLAFAMQSLETARTPPPDTTRARRILLIVSFVLTVTMIGLTSWLVLGR